jgi:hypothetical protein
MSAWARQRVVDRIVVQNRAKVITQAKQRLQRGGEQARAKVQITLAISIR